MKKNRNKGFTLIELLATIAILSLILVIGYVVYGNFIKNAKDKKNEITMKNVLSAAETYSKEIDETSWTNTGIYCTSVYELINLGYFKKDEFKDSSQNDSEIAKNTKILIQRDNLTKAIRSVQIDKGGVCKSSYDSAVINVDSFTDKIIHVKAKCNGNSKYEFLLNSESKSGIIADSEYTFNNLKDDSEYNLAVQCYNDNDTKIEGKRADTNHSTGSSISFINSSLCGNKVPVYIYYDKNNSDTVKFYLESDTGSVVSNVDEKYKVKECESVDKCNDNDIKKELYAKKWYYINKTDFSIEDKTGKFIVYVISKSDIKIKVKTEGTNENIKFSSENEISQIKAFNCVNSDNICKSGLKYLLDTPQTLTNEIDGVTFENNEGMNAGDYKVKANLKDGYVWSDYTTTPKEFNCKIDKATPGLELSSDSNSVGKGGNISISYQTDVKSVLKRFEFVLENSIGELSTPYSERTSKSGSIIFYGRESGSTNLVASLYIKDEDYKDNYNPVSKKINLNVTNDIVNSIIEITLKPGDEYTTRGTNKIYEKYDVGVYLDSSASSKKMTTSNNKIEIPTRDGYTFAGYYTQKEGEGDQLINANGYITNDFKPTRFIRNKSLFAKWVEVEQTQNGEDYCECGYERNKLKCQTFSNCVLNGNIYYCDDGGSFSKSAIGKFTDSQGREYGITKGACEGDESGNYNQSSTKYTLTFDSQSGSYCDSKTFNANDKFSNYICYPTRSGYEFGGWYTKKNGSGTNYTSSTKMPSNNLTLYAKWTVYSGNTTSVEEIYANRCDDNTSGKDNLYYITTCTSDKCNYTKKNGTSTSGTINRYSLKDEKYCYRDEINGKRCTDGNPPTNYNITYCQSSSISNPLCRISNSTNTVSRYSLGMPECKCTQTNYNDARIVNGMWNVYKTPGYVISTSCASSVYSYIKKACVPAADNPLSKYHIGYTSSNANIYLKLSNNSPTETTTYNGKQFIKIYIEKDNVNTNSSDCGSVNSCNAGSYAICGKTYYAVWIAATCNTRNKTCEPSGGTSIGGIEW